MDRESEKGRQPLTSRVQMDLLLQMDQFLNHQIRFQHLP